MAEASTDQLQISRAGQSVSTLHLVSHKISKSIISHVPCIQ